jgi:DNA-binding FrmR family transcriptional regulator
MPLTTKLQTLSVFSKVFSLEARIVCESTRYPGNPTGIHEILNKLTSYPPGWDIDLMHKTGKKGKAAEKSILLRLKRARGHLDSVVKMIEEEKSCLDVSRQLHAVAKAVTEAKRIFIQDHIEHCLDENTIRDGDMSIEDFKEMTKYL